MKANDIVFLFLSIITIILHFLLEIPFKYTFLSVLIAGIMYLIKAIDEIKEKGG